MPTLAKISPFLMFNDQAEEAAKFYVSVFPDSKILAITRFGKNQPGPEGSVLTVAIDLCGQEIVLGNGGPPFKFEMGVSLSVACDSQREIDDLWEKLPAGGKTLDCSWLQDRFGVFWQIVPRRLNEMMKDPNPTKVEQVMNALLTMQKLDIAKLETAYRA